MLGCVSFVKPMQDFRAAVFWAFYCIDMTISSRDGLKTAEGSRNLEYENKMMT